MKGDSCFAVDMVSPFLAAIIDRSLLFCAGIRLDSDESDVHQNGDHVAF